jgi:aerobic-type carbon monoxide dehydrogenase small subunit (CoxS/CutS family)
VNGKPHEASVSPRVTLLDWLREGIGLTCARNGCNEGACGTCTVFVNGKRMNACLTLVAQCDGCEVTTVEGISAANGALHPMQRAFIEHDAFQCGYCTPGQIISAIACVAEGHATDEAGVRERHCNKRDPGSGCAARNDVIERHAIFGWTDACVAVQPSDPAVALACLDATADVVGPQGTRTIKMAEFHLAQQEAMNAGGDAAGLETRLGVSQDDMRAG